MYGISAGEIMQHNRRKSDHPGWITLRIALFMMPVTVFLWKNASNFDITEIKSIVQIAGVLAGFEGFRRGIAFFK